MRTEAIKYFKFMRKILCEDNLKFCPKNSIAYQANRKEKEFYDMAINALEQEFIIDKLRVMLDEHIEYNKKMNYMGIVSGLLLAKSLIDYIKAESEGLNEN